MKEVVKKKKVYVGLSGGVDSSVSALLLKEAGYDVTGVFIKVWHPDFLQCDWKSEMRDAMRVCSKLKIPFKKLDLESVYKENIIDYMITEYSKGRTPNPDVMCNKYVKFGAFLDWALSNGADFIATGHYTQKTSISGIEYLKKSADESKDQTYFLWTLIDKELKHSIFPIGHLHKKQVREIAEKNNLYTFSKKDSQGLCFIGQVDMKEFLKKYIDVESGKVLSESGEIIGTHDGALLYTIGERHGFSINSDFDRTKPYYVIDKDIEKNTLTVSQDETSLDERITGCIVQNISYTKNSLDFNKKYTAQIRYHGEFYEIEIKNDDINKIIFKEVPKSISIGQSIVIYDEDICIGGGIIDTLY